MTATPHAEDAPVLNYRIDRMHSVDRELLTTDTFTDVLRRVHGEDIEPVVLVQRERAVDPAMAKRLRLVVGDIVLERHAALRTMRSQRVVTYAQSAIVMARLTPFQQTAILDGPPHAPLGDVLRVAELDREVLEFQDSQPAPYEGARLLDPLGLKRQIISRLSRVSIPVSVGRPHEGQPVAIFAEYWRAFDPCES